MSKRVWRQALAALLLVLKVPRAPRIVLVSAVAQHRRPGWSEGGVRPRVALTGKQVWQVGDADGKFFSATIRWERIGATPQMLRNLCDPTFCQTDPCQATAAGTQCFINAPNCIDFNFDRDAGCSSYDHRTVLYTVVVRSVCAAPALLVRAPARLMREQGSWLAVNRAPPCVRRNTCRWTPSSTALPSQTDTTCRVSVPRRGQTRPQSFVWERLWMTTARQWI